MQRINFFDYIQTHDMAEIRNQRDLIENGYSLMPSVEFSTVKTLEKEFDSKKKVQKYLRAVASLPDSGKWEINPEPNSKLLLLIKCLGYDKMMKLFNKLQSIEGLSFHNLLSNIPKINPKNKEKSDEIFNFLMKVLSIKKQETIFTLLLYLNYAKVRNGKNVESMLKHINFVEVKKNGFAAETRAFSDLLLERNEEIFDNDIYFSKNVRTILNIGSETFCCFKKGGAAESLLKVSIESPISGILCGNMGSRWFSFVWEIVEFNEETKKFEKNLVLDNIEAKQTLTEEEFSKMLEVLSKTNYKRIYCGTMRNDIPTVSDTIQNTKKDKPYSAIGYEKNFKSYAYDDSKQIYTFLTKEETSIEKITVKKMNKADLYRVGYVERLIWEGNSDDDFLKTKVEESPSYVIESDQYIYGYFITEIWYYDSNNHKLSNSELNQYKNNRRENGEENLYEGLTRVLYFSDIYLYKNKKVVLSLKEIFDNIIEFLKENPDIKTVSANTNNNSKHFLKRLKDNNLDVEYEEEGIPSCYINPKYENLIVDTRLI